MTSLPARVCVWSDPGIVFDEARGSINYWEPWYLGLEAGRTRKPGLVTSDNPRTGTYAQLIDEGGGTYLGYAADGSGRFFGVGRIEDFPALGNQPQRGD